MDHQITDDSLLRRAGYAAGLVLLMVVAQEIGLRRVELEEASVLLTMAMGYLAAAGIGGLVAASFVKQRRLRLIIIAQLAATVLAAILV